MRNPIQSKHPKQINPTQWKEREEWLHKHTALKRNTVKDKPRQQLRFKTATSDFREEAKTNDSEFNEEVEQADTPRGTLRRDFNLARSSNSDDKKKEDTSMSSQNAIRKKTRIDSYNAHRVRFDLLFIAEPNFYLLSLQLYQFLAETIDFSFLQ